MHRFLVTPGRAVVSGMFCVDCSLRILSGQDFPAENVVSCTYDNGQCRGHLWQCRTCREWFCQAHGHVTDKGRNVECVACERERKEEECQQR